MGSDYPIILGTRREKILIDFELFIAFVPNLSCSWEMLSGKRVSRPSAKKQEADQTASSDKSAKSKKPQLLSPVSSSRADDGEILMTPGPKAPKSKAILAPGEEKSLHPVAPARSFGQSQPLENQSSSRGESLASFG